MSRSNQNVNIDSVEPFATGLLQKLVSLIGIDEYLRKQVSSVISQLTLDFRISLYTQCLNQISQTSLVIPKIYSIMWRIF